MRKPRETPWLATRNGVYYANWYDQSERRTKSLSLRTSDKATATNRFGAFLQQGKVIFAADDVGLSGLSVATALDQYEREHVAKNVVDRGRQAVIITHLKAFFGTTPLRDVDIPMSRAYADARREGRIGGGQKRKGDLTKGSDSTIRRELVVLRAAIAHARRWKRISLADNPTLELPPDSTPEEAKWLSKDELNALFKTTDGDLRDFIAIAYYTGARRKSVETLRVEQIELDRKRINLRKQGEKVTKKRRPIVPIHSKIAGILEKRIEDASEGWIFGPRADFYRPFRAACERAGIDELRSHPHVLRHSRATHLLMDGVNIYDVAKLLGDTITTVERVYGHSCEAHLAETVGDL